MDRIEDRINVVVRDLLSDYENGRVIDEVKSFDHPDKDVIVEIIYSIRRIIFPGYFRNKSYRVYTVRNNISMLTEDIIFKLIWNEKEAVLPQLSPVSGPYYRWSDFTDWVNGLKTAHPEIGN